MRLLFLVHLDWGFHWVLSPSQISNSVKKLKDLEESQILTFLTNSLASKELGSLIVNNAEGN